MTKHIYLNVMQKGVKSKEAEESKHEAVRRMQRQIRMCREMQLKARSK